MSLRLPSPPPVPLESIYTSCYCEENAYLLCRNFLDTPSVNGYWEVFVVFISNDNKTVALWCQKAARHPDNPVIWDYHVVLILRSRLKGYSTDTKLSRTQSWIYDFDTNLDLPCPWKEYFSMTFPEDLLPAYESLFRVVSGENYMQHFASDRSHMLLHASDIPPPKETVYSSPPPNYEPICGPAAMEHGITNNLMQSYVVMKVKQDHSESDSYGVVLERLGAQRFFMHAS